jgi:hypothetical protein
MKLAILFERLLCVVNMTKQFYVQREQKKNLNN